METERDFAAEFPAEAFSEEGYLIDQGKLRRIAYGRYTSDYNGCGWIAAYNLLHLCGIKMQPSDVCRMLARGLRLGGKFGTFPLFLRKYLRRYLPVQLRIRTKKQFCHAHGDRGIILYWTGKGAHNVGFCSEQDGGGNIRFLNAVYGKKNYLLTAEAFWKKHVHFPLCLVFEVKQLEKKQQV